MTDHETYLLLAAKQLSEPLSTEEEAELGAHLASCPACRSRAAGLSRDDILLRAELGVAKISPRVRRRVLDEAYGRRHVDPRLILGLAATLLLAAIGVPLITGARLVSVPSPVMTLHPPSRAPTPSLAASQSLASPSAAGPVLSPSPTGVGPFVSGAYTYAGERTTRRDTVSAHFDGQAVGEWSRTTPATGEGIAFGGPVTCLVISGKDAWLAGPASTATDGTTDRAAFLYVHDGGPDGRGDTAVLWMNNVGQTLQTMTGWCESRFIPAGPFPLTSGDVAVENGRE